MSIYVPAELTPVGPAVAAPPRRAGSVRRTSTIDATWPNGRQGETVLTGHARDLLTPVDGEAVVLAEERLTVVLEPDRRIRSIELTPARTDLSDLVGGPSGSGYRARLAEVAPDEVTSGSPGHLLLDDIPGAALVSGFAFSRWYDLEELRAENAFRRPLPVMTGICTGFQEGSSGLAPDGRSRWNHNTRLVEEVDGSDDPLAWHEVPHPTEISMRRSRRIDVWVDDETIHADAFFQDSCTLPQGGRQAVHEYTVTAQGDRVAGTLTGVHPVPRVLPYNECPLAVQNVGVLEGVPLRRLRPIVLEQLKKTAGCTHLNATLRSLSDLPVLADALEK